MGRHTFSSGLALAAGFVHGEWRIEATVPNVIVPNTGCPGACASILVQNAWEGVGWCRSEGIGILVTSREKSGNVRFWSEGSVFGDVTTVEAIDAEECDIIVFLALILVVVSIVPRSGIRGRAKHGAEDEMLQMHDDGAGLALY